MNNDESCGYSFGCWKVNKNGKKQIVNKTHNFSVNLGKNISLNKNIENLCTDLFKKLDKEYAEKIMKLY